MVIGMTAMLWPERLMVGTGAAGGGGGDAGAGAGAAGCCAEAAQASSTGAMKMTLRARVTAGKVNRCRGPV
jgi:hypothetical protein